MANVVPPEALWWMLIGGMCYMIGVQFLIYDKKFPRFHALWHVLVIAGSAWHYFAILFYVVQAG